MILNGELHTSKLQKLVQTEYFTRKRKRERSSISQGWGSQCFHGSLSLSLGVPVWEIPLANSLSEVNPYPQTGVGWTGLIRQVLDRTRLTPGQDYATEGTPLAVTQDYCLVVINFAGRWPHRKKLHVRRLAAHVQEYS